MTSSCCTNQQRRIGLTYWKDERMNSEHIQLATDTEFKFIECKFTVESKIGIGGNMSNKRITFEGYATQGLYETLSAAIEKVVGA